MAGSRESLCLDGCSRKEQFLLFRLTLTKIRVLSVDQFHSWFSAEELELWDLDQECFWSLLCRSWVLFWQSTTLFPWSTVPETRRSEAYGFVNALWLLKQSSFRYLKLQPWLWPYFIYCWRLSRTFGVGLPGFWVLVCIYMWCIQLGFTWRLSCRFSIL